MDKSKTNISYHHVRSTLLSYYHEAIGCCGCCFVHSYEHVAVAGDRMSRHDCETNKKKTIKLILVLCKYEILLFDTLLVTTE